MPAAWQEVLLLSADPSDGGGLTAGLTRLGAVIRLITFDDPALSARLEATRPDVVIVRATSEREERSAARALEPLLDGLRALLVPILALVRPAVSPTGDLVRAVDDIVLPPHEPAETLLRAALIARRRGASGPNLVSTGPLTLDVDGFRAWLAGQPVTLTYTEFQLLRLLMLNRGKVLSRQTLLTKIWGYDYLGGLRTVDVHIRRLRAKIEATAPDLIETVRLAGYRVREGP